jgi:glutaredoxin/glutathione-dependent peroxiredoxin
MTDLRGDMIQIGDQLPTATLFESTEFGPACPTSPSKVDVTQAASGKTIAIFGLPGAFTPTCSAKHVPGYVEKLPALKAKGVDEVWCVSLNDGYVMAAWGRELGVLGKIRMLGDGTGELTRKLGLEVELGGLGVRMRRFSMLVENGFVKQLNVEEPGRFERSDADTTQTLC